MSREAAISVKHWDYIGAKVKRELMRKYNRPGSVDGLYREMWIFAMVIWLLVPIQMTSIKKELKRQA